MSSKNGIEIIKPHLNIIGSGWFAVLIKMCIVESFIPTGRICQLKSVWFSAVADIQPHSVKVIMSVSYNAGLFSSHRTSCDETMAVSPVDIWMKHLFTGLLFQNVWVTVCCWPKSLSAHIDNCQPAFFNFSLNLWFWLMVRKQLLLEVQVVHFHRWVFLQHHWFLVPFSVDLGGRSRIYLAWFLVKVRLLVFNNIPMYHPKYPARIQLCIKWQCQHLPIPLITYIGLKTHQLFPSQWQTDILSPKSFRKGFLCLK